MSKKIGCVLLLLAIFAGLFALVGVFAGWAAAGIAFAVLALIFLVCGWFDHRAVQAGRRNHVATHEPMPDEEFLRGVGLSEADSEFVLKCRQAIARSMGVPAETVHPNHALEDMGKCQSVGPDLPDLACRLDEEFSVHLAPRLFLLPRQEPMLVPDEDRKSPVEIVQTTIAQLIRHLAEHWDEIADPKPDAATGKQRD